MKDELIDKFNFSKYKGSRLIKIEDDILYCLDFKARKNFIWYAFYPLALPEISFRWGPHGAHGLIDINQDTQQLIDKISVLLNEFKGHHQYIKTVEAHKDKIGTNFVLAYSNFSIGEIEKGKIYLKKYIQSQKMLMDTNVCDPYESYMAYSIEDWEVLLNEERVYNVENLELKNKYFVLYK